MEPTNLLYILSDEHARDALGCYGNPAVRTPNLDRLASRGTQFTAAYTPCPICVPARAALATGQYVHQIGNWDNAHPYDGSRPSWHHALREQGFTIDSIGKLHFSGPQHDHGFSRTIDPLHVVDGTGDILSCIREDPPRRKKRGGILEAGAGDSTYQQYDRQNTANALSWLEAHRNDQRPWVLFLSFVCPHPPYTAPQDLFESYLGQDLPTPPQWQEQDWPRHPALEAFRRFFDFDRPFSREQLHRLTAAYYGVCTFLDQQIGCVLDQVEALGLMPRTRVLYTSDHGECLGARGLVGKFTLYDESAAIPMIVAGPQVPEGQLVGVPVSLLDIAPTTLESVGAQPSAPQHRWAGESLLEIARQPERNRMVLSEYHAVGSHHASYMLRDQRYKYNYYVNSRPQLFDLREDPQELRDLAGSADHAGRLDEYKAELRSLLDPEAVDARAKADQKAKVDAHGGEAAVRSRGSFENSPVPGEKPVFRP